MVWALAVVTVFLLLRVGVTVVVYRHCCRCSVDLNVLGYCCGCGVSVAVIVVCLVLLRVDVVVVVCDCCSRGPASAGKVRADEHLVAVPEQPLTLTRNKSGKSPAAGNCDQYSHWLYPQVLFPLHNTPSRHPVPVLLFDS